MGKAQSKRSVDITTEAKKEDVVEEGTGKMGKIEDGEQLKPQVNGDTHHNETELGDKEKAEAEGTENEKDLSTEKEQPQAEPKAKLEGGDDATAADTAAAAAATATTPTTADDKPAENGNDDTLNESKASVDVSQVNGENATAAGDSSKKPKKEKVKKKWSLRSISFGKKDKQKPPKKEETVTNGECEKVPEEAAEEAPKNGEAAATENGANDEKSPAISPAVESKEIIASAASAEPVAAAVAAVLNGTSEPAKDEKPIAEVKPVVEEKKVEPVAAPAAPVAEEPKVAEPVSAPAITEATLVDALKEKCTIDVVSPAKIEVKPDSIQEEDKQASKSSNEEVIDIQQQDTKNEELKKMNDDGDSESAQNLSPPPLPCTSPPSQVTMFALSDSKAPAEQDVDDLPPPPPSPPVELEAKLDDIKEEVPTVVEAISAAPAEATPAVVAEEKPVESVKVMEITASVPAVQEQEASPESTSVNVIKEKFEESPLEKEIASALTEVGMETKIEEPENSETIDSVIESKPEKEINETTSEATSSGINQEQIAQTIALIDEVTQAAIVDVSNKLDEVSSSSTVESSPLLDDKPAASTEQTSNVSETTVEESSQLPDVVNDSSESKPNTIESISDQRDDTQQAAALIKSTEDHKEADNKTNGIEELEAIVPPSKEENVAEKIEQTADILNAAVIESVTVTTTTGEQNESEEASAQSPKSKENGFGENHAAETSATESLNGHDHKTIEDIKTDCSDKIISEPTTELAVAGTVQVAE